MRVVIQRVKNASVSIEGTVKSSIQNGLLILVGFEDSDNQEDIEWLCGKILRLRIFNDQNGVMNLSVMDVDGEILVISQFTLHASTKKGNRPSYIKSAKHKQSIVSGVGFEMLSGTDWAGRRFTTIEELLKTGETVTWGKKGPVDWDQFPSYVISQVMGAQPIQVQNFIAWVNGEQDGFDALSKSIGLRTTSTYKKKNKKTTTF